MLSSKIVEHQHHTAFLSNLWYPYHGSTLLTMQHQLQFPLSDEMSRKDGRPCNRIEDERLSTVDERTACQTLLENMEPQRQCCPHKSASISTLAMRPEGQNKQSWAS